MSEQRARIAEAVVPRFNARVIDTGSARGILGRIISANKSNT
jgi:hypothetical protein